MLLVIDRGTRPEVAFRVTKRTFGCSHWIRQVCPSISDSLRRDTFLKVKICQYSAVMDIVYGMLACRKHTLLDL